jgi:hypothetical protein
MAESNTMPESHLPIQNHASGLTPAERRIAHQLDALGLAERDAAEPGLEERVFEASKKHLPGPKPLNSPRIFGWRSRFALAACLALAGAAIWYASNPFTPTPTAPTSGSHLASSHVALAELEAEVGFTLDALLASYRVENATPREAGTPQAPSGSFWDSSTDPFGDLDEEISL